MPLVANLALSWIEDCFRHAGYVAFRHPDAVVASTPGRADWVLLRATGDGIAVIGSGYAIIKTIPYCDPQLFEKVGACASQVLQAFGVGQRDLLEPSFARDPARGPGLRGEACGPNGSR